MVQVLTMSSPVALAKMRRNKLADELIPASNLVEGWIN
jgi:hypothetical protein